MPLFFVLLSDIAAAANADCCVCWRSGRLSRPSD